MSAYPGKIKLNYLKASSKHIKYIAKNINMASSSKRFDDIYKIVLLGDSHVGKTTFLSQYIPEGTNLNRSKVNDMEAKTETIGNRKVDVQVWDLSGDPNYRAVSDIYFKKAHGAFIIFDINNRASFTSVESWINDLIAVNPTCKLMIIGNKAELRSKSTELQTIPSQEAAALASKFKAPYVELSSLNPEHVRAVFKGMIKAINTERADEPDGSYSLFVVIFLILGTILLVWTG